MACLSYLSFRYFDSDITDDEVEGFIGKGEYVLQQYTQSNFLHHIRGAWRDAGRANKIPNVTASTKEFLKARWNPCFRSDGSGQPSSSSGPEHVQPTDAEVYEKLNIISARLREHSFTESTKGLSLRCTWVTDYWVVYSHLHVSRHGPRAIAFGRHLPPYHGTFRHTGLEILLRRTYQLRCFASLLWSSTVPLFYSFLQPPQTRL